MLERRIHSHEQGRRGKPDRLDANIAHLLAAQALRIDRNARCDIHVVGSYFIPDDRGSYPSVIVSGEVSSQVLPVLRSHIDGIVRNHYRDVHQGDDHGLVVDARFLKPQSAALSKNDRAGDSGTAIAVAYAHTPHYLPLERYLAVALVDLIDGISSASGQVPEPLRREAGISAIPGLRADGKISVEVQYLGAVGSPTVTDVTLALNHEGSISLDHLRRDATSLITAYLRSEEKKLQGRLDGVDLTHGEIVINGAGSWQDQGGWKTDDGSRDAKPQEAYFGSYGVCEDAPWGEDPSKPSGTGTLMARYIANQVVAQGFADFAEVRLVYKIGKDQPRLNITTHGTGHKSQDEIEAWAKNRLGDFSVAAAVERFGLRDPLLYERIVHGSDLFHDPELPWNVVLGAR
ncbi:MAG TPA: methionine adenosyltransferase domain-containing protein [Candidatus Nanoarchaeia archaeon]|nr:methionine adenosyltransferase domain-containing protein [Candidatus Nanoarchaeia archaeon]